MYRSSIAVADVYPVQRGMPFCEKRDTFVIVVLQCHELLTNGLYRSLAHLPAHGEENDRLEERQETHDNVPEFGEEVWEWDGFEVGAFRFG